MDGNLTPGRSWMRECPRDISFSKQTALPQKVYCSIEMRTMSPPASACWPVRWARHRVDSWSHLNDEPDNCNLNTEIRYDLHERINESARSIEYGSSEDDFNWGFKSRQKEQKGKKARACSFKGRVGRNARERRRVMAVSGAFLRLRRAVPQGSGGTSKRLSKLKTLKSAIEYITELQDVLNMLNQSVGQQQT